MQPYKRQKTGTKYKMRIPVNRGWLNDVRAFNRPRGIQSRKLYPSTTTHRVEWKQKYVEFQEACNTTGALVLCNGLAQGVDDGQRIGRQVMLRSISFRAIHQVIPTTGVDQEGRVLVVYHRATNGNPPLTTDILEAGTWNEHINHDTKDDFVTLMDWTIIANHTAEPGSNHFKKMYKRFRLPEKFYNTSVGSVVDIVTGSIYVVIIGSQAAGVTAAVVSGNISILYEDV